MTDADLDEVAALLEAAAPGHAKARADILRWHYGRRTFGEPVALVAEADGRVVGHFGYVPAPVRLDGTEVPAALTGNLAVHPEHRGAGIARRLVSGVRRAGSDAGLRLLVSYTNDDSLPILTALGWRHVGDPRILAAVVPGGTWRRVPAWLWRAATTAGALASWRPGRRRLEAVIDLSAELPDDLDAVSAWDRGGDGFVRSADWLGWRYQGHPASPYRVVTVRRGNRLVGLGVCSIRHGGSLPAVQLLDALAADVEACASVLDGARRLAGAEGCPLVVAGAMARSNALTMLREAGMVVVPRRAQPRPIHLLAADLDEAPGTGRVAARTWAFGLGDQDHL